MPENFNLGKCCACETEGPTVRSIVMIERKMPRPGVGCWGCLQCGLPQQGAYAVLCDRCIETHAVPKFVCVGPAACNERLPLDQVTEPFEHDMSKHPEYQVERAQWN